MADYEKQTSGRGISSAEGRRLALIVGVNASVKSIYRAPLKFAEDDAYEVARTLESSACNFTLLKPVLRGKEATTRDVKEAIIELIEESIGEDFLCFYFSGHAQPMKVKGDRQDVYLVTHDFSESQVLIDPAIHLSMRWLWEILYQRTEVRKIILILDCCYAGNMLTTGADPYQIDLYKLFEDYFEDEDTKEKANRSRFILSATGYDTVTHEQDGHGIMTGFFLKALRGEVASAYDEEGYLDIYALYTYLQNMMQGNQPNLSGEGRHRCLLAWHLPQSDVFRQSIQQTDRLLITEADFFEKLGEIYTKPHKQPFDHILCKDVSLADIKMESVTDFFQKERVQQQSDFSLGLTNQELLEQFGLIRDSLLTYGVLLCFGKNPSLWITGAFTRCIFWKGNDRLDGWHDERSFRGNLLEQFEASIEFLQRNLHLSRTIHTTGSVEQWEIPLVALREALANALIHREYANQTNFVQVELFNDRVEINSPGGLPDFLVVLQLGEEKQYPLRNPQIARIFYLYNYAEEAGSGIPRMRHAMKMAGRPSPQFIVSKAKIFSVILRRPKQISFQQVTQTRFLSVKRAIDSKQGYRSLSLVLMTVLIMMSLIIRISPKVFFDPNSQSFTPSPTSIIQSTPEYHSNPYPPYVGNLFLDDPMTDGSNRSRGNWQVIPPDPYGEACEFKPDGYHVITMANTYKPCHAYNNTYFSDFTFEVQMTVLSGICGGISLRDNAQAHAYAFLVCQNGIYSFYRFDTFSGVQTLKEGESAYINMGINHANVIAVVAIMGHFDLYINYKDIGSLQDNTYLSGAFGVSAESHSEVVYVNARLWK